MAIIHIWGWRNVPDGETARRENSAALDDLEKRYLELFPNEHVNGVLGGADLDTNGAGAVQILVETSFEIGLLEPERKRNAELALAETYRKRFPEWPGTIEAFLR